MSDEIKRLLNSKREPKTIDKSELSGDVPKTVTKPITPIESKKINSQPKMSKPIISIIVAVLIVSSGSFTGYALSRLIGPSKTSSPVGGIDTSTGEIVQGEISAGDVLGSGQKNGDSAEGVLQIGGINGEGSHRILRPRGPSQTVYLTSSVVDLNQLDGHKVKVWGDTFAAQSAGWLMDVVTLEVVELNAPLPFEE